VIKFVWSRLIHAPLPSKLVHVDYYWLKNCGTGVNVNLEPVKVSVSVSFEIESFSPNFCYKGRTIATPFLSTAGLGDPERDRRLLGNSVYSPTLSHFGLSSFSFTTLFTGADDLGYYDLNVALLRSSEETLLLPSLSKHAVVNYYVVDVPGERRISGFFKGYEEAQSFALKFFMKPNEDVKNFFMTPIMTSSIRSCIRRLKHPVGFFSHVQTMAGSINASELLFEFKNHLKYGGAN